ncbi:MAG: hypothetical protein ACKOSS_05570 [Planctomycetia bacterium]
MRNDLPRPVVLSVLLALLAGVAFLGAQAPQRSAAATTVRGGPPPARAWASACAGKPALPIGGLALAVVSRPTGDEAWVQASWQRGPAGESPRVELVLPQGATLLDGEPWQALPEGVASGTLAWRVRFATTCTSDLVARLHASLGSTPASREAVVRLWECE